MKKRQTKAQRFRQLLPEIEKLQEEYLQEAVVEILNEQYGLDINLNTFKNYLHRYGSNKSEEILVRPKNSETEIFDDNQNPILSSEMNSNNSEELDMSKWKKDIEILREKAGNQSIFKKG